MMALAEKRYGFGRNADDFIYISLGVGIGCAIFIHGALYRGHANLAGEFGHITVEAQGPLCRCGNLGCLEALASANAIIQRAKGSVQSGVYSSLSDKIDEIYRNADVKAIAQAAEEGDKLAFEILDRTGMYIGIGIAMLINILNPSMVILGGGIAQSGEVLLSAINQTVRKQALGIISRTVSIQKCQIKEYAGVIGGATAFFDRIFAPK
jgi:glucokinase